MIQPTRLDQPVGSGRGGAASGSGCKLADAGLDVLQRDRGNAEADVVLVQLRLVEEPRARLDQYAARAGDFGERMGVGTARAFKPDRGTGRGVGCLPFREVGTDSLSQ